MPPISLRIDPLNWILLGRLGVELEVGLIKWISVETVPMFVTTESPPWLSYGSSIDVTQHSTGWGPLAGASLGVNFWLSGKALQGYSLGTGFRSYGIEYRTTADSASHTARELYALFGSVSRWGAFTIAGGIGLSYDFNNESRCYSEDVFGAAEVGPGDCDEIQLATGFPLRNNPVVVVSPFAYPWDILVRFSLGVTID